jgi:hypothetical protein
MRDGPDLVRRHGTDYVAAFVAGGISFIPTHLDEGVACYGFVRDDRIALFVVGHNCDRDACSKTGFSHDRT